MAFRKPVKKHGKTWRMHRCKCGTVFISVQTALTPRDAQTWMDLLEGEEASMTQTDGSSSTSDVSDGSSGSESQAS